MFRAMRYVGFLNQIRETAAFCQMLAMSSWHLAYSYLNKSQKRTDHMAYSLLATRELQRQINDPEQNTTDDAIAAVLVFACYAVSSQQSKAVTSFVNDLCRTFCMILRQ
jgi:hypothetical protein